MALPASGQITLNQVNVELGLSGTAQIGMNDAAVRGLFGIASGEIEMSDGYGKSNVAWYGERGVFAGSGAYPGMLTMQYITIATTGNASTFGDFSAPTNGKSFVGQVSDGSRGVMAGGLPWNQAGATNDMSYITFATTGNSTDFGDLNRSDMIFASVSNGPRGVFAGGSYRPGYRLFTDEISYITIASTGNATDFGNLLSANTDFWAYQVGASNGTRGLIAGNGPYVATNVIQYITIASTGNATDFGDLTLARGQLGGTNGGDRAVFAGGYYEDTVGHPQKIIDYVSIPTTGNATSFGNLASLKSTCSGLSDNSRAVFHNGNGYDLEYITISTTGNATDFGDLVYSGEIIGNSSSGT